MNPVVCVLSPPGWLNLGGPYLQGVLRVGIIGHEKANDEVTEPLQDGQDQVSVPQVPLLDHGDAIETLNFICRDNSPNQGLSPCVRAMSLAFGVCHEFRDTST